MKKLIMAATLAALTVTSAAMAAPLRDPQPGDLKANANYGFDQKEGGRSAKSRISQRNFILFCFKNLMFNNIYGSTRRRLNDFSTVLCRHYFSTEQSIGNIYGSATTMRPRTTDIYITS